MQNFPTRIRLIEGGSEQSPLLGGGGFESETN